MRRLVIGFVGFVIVFVTPCGAKAEEPSAKVSPFQIAIWNPVQLVPDDWDVWGLRLNLPYGKNREVVGIDLGLVNFAMAFEGVQLGVFNFAMGVDVHARAPADIFIDSKGIQIGCFNGCRDFAGVQIGGYNFSEDFAGVQIAGNFNMADSFTGLQVAGFGNSTMGGGRGIQIAGLWNLNGKVYCQGVQLAALVNCSESMKGVQIGLVNIAGKMIGIQIGVVNIIKDSPVPFFPIINAHF